MFYVINKILGTISVDPRLDDQPQQLVIRQSMRKFTSEHDQLEICKISSPRTFYFEIYFERSLFFDFKVHYI